MPDQVLDHLVELARRVHGELTRSGLPLLDHPTPFGDDPPSASTDSEDSYRTIVATYRRYRSLDVHELALLCEYYRDALHVEEAGEMVEYESPQPRRAKPSGMYSLTEWPQGLATLAGHPSVDH